MRLVCAAITANTAVDERASKECLRHQGYASAIQNVSKPACSHAWAMAKVSCTGSMLSCRTPRLNGTVTSSDQLLALRIWFDESTTQFPDFGSQFSEVQSGSFHECSNPLINSNIARFRGVGTPNFSPHCTIAPFMKSTSVCRLASTSCNMLALCLPGALAPFCTSCRGSPCRTMPNFLATASPSAIRSLNSCPVGSKRVAAP